MDSTGMNVEVTDRKIEVPQVMGEIGDPGHGAQVLFVGVVRNNNQGKKVVAVSYDAFAPLAAETFRQICSEARAKWGESLRICVKHRTGKLEIGEISVAIAVGTPHRDAAYQASRYVIEELKVRSPIWKKEHYEDGDSEWLQGHALCGHSH